MDKIIHCVFEKAFNFVEVFGITQEGKRERICGYYEDEFHYTEIDFNGMTVQEAREKHHKNVVSYFKS